MRVSVHVRVQGEFVQVVVLIKGIVVSQVDEFLQGLVDEDDADEWGKGFLCKTCDVANQGTGICSHQRDTEESCPQTNTGSQWQIGQAVLPVWRLKGGQSLWNMWEIKSHRILISGLEEIIITVKWSGLLSIQSEHLMICSRPDVWEMFHSCPENLSHSKPINTSQCNHRIMQCIDEMNLESLLIQWDDLCVHYILAEFEQYLFKHKHRSCAAQNGKGLPGKQGIGYSRQWGSEQRLNCTLGNGKWQRDYWWMVILKIFTILNCNCCLV